MGLREKVTLVSAAVLIIQITTSYCIPYTYREGATQRYLHERGIKTVNNPFITSNVKMNKNISPEKSMYKTYNFPETEFPVDASSRSPFYIERNLNTNSFPYKTKNVSNLPCKAVEEFKKDLRMKRKLDAQGAIQTLTKSFPEPETRFTDIEAFPEVQYPMNVIETWAPHYWNPKTLCQIEQQYEEPKFKIINPEKYDKGKPFTSYKKRKSKTQQFFEEINKLSEQIHSKKQSNKTREHDRKIESTFTSKRNTEQLNQSGTNGSNIISAFEPSLNKTTEELDNTYLQKYLILTNNTKNYDLKNMQFNLTNNLNPTTYEPNEVIDKNVYTLREEQNSYISKSKNTSNIPQSSKEEPVEDVEQRITIENTISPPLSVQKQLTATTLNATNTVAVSNTLPFQDYINNINDTVKTSNDDPLNINIPIPSIHEASTYNWKKEIKQSPNANGSSRTHINVVPVDNSIGQETNITSGDKNTDPTTILFKPTTRVAATKTISNTVPASLLITQSEPSLNKTTEELDNTYLQKYLILPNNTKNYDLKNMQFNLTNNLNPTTYEPNKVIDKNVHTLREEQNSYVSKSKNTSNTSQSSKEEPVDDVEQRITIENTISPPLSVQKQLTATTLNATNTVAVSNTLPFQDYINNINDTVKTSNDDPLNINIPIPSIHEASTYNWKEIKQSPNANGSSRTHINVVPVDNSIGQETNITSGDKNTDPTTILFKPTTRLAATKTISNTVPASLLITQSDNNSIILTPVSESMCNNSKCHVLSNKEKSTNIRVQESKSTKLKELTDNSSYNSSSVCNNSTTSREELLNTDHLLFSNDEQTLLKDTTYFNDLNPFSNGERNTSDVILHLSEKDKMNTNTTSQYIGTNKTDNKDFSNEQSLFFAEDDEENSFKNDKNEIFLPECIVQTAAAAAASLTSHTNKNSILPENTVLTKNPTIEAMSTDKEFFDPLNVIYFQDKAVNHNKIDNTTSSEKPSSSKYTVIMPIQENNNNFSKRNSTANDIHRSSFLPQNLYKNNVHFINVMKEDSSLFGDQQIENVSLANDTKKESLLHKQKSLFGRLSEMNGSYQKYKTLLKDILLRLEDNSLTNKHQTNKLLDIIPVHFDSSFKEQANNETKIHLNEIKNNYTSVSTSLLNHISPRDSNRNSPNNMQPLRAPTTNPGEDKPILENNKNLHRKCANNSEEVFQLENEMLRSSEYLDHTKGILNTSSIDNQGALLCNISLINSFLSDNPNTEIGNMTNVMKNITSLNYIRNGVNENLLSFDISALSCINKSLETMIGNGTVTGKDLDYIKMIDTLPDSNDTLNQEMFSIDIPDKTKQDILFTGNDKVVSTRNILLNPLESKSETNILSFNSFTDNANAKNVTVDTISFELDSGKVNHKNVHTFKEEQNYNTSESKNTFTPQCLKEESGDDVEQPITLENIINSSLVQKQQRAIVHNATVRDAVFKAVVPLQNYNNMVEISKDDLMLLIPISLTDVYNKALTYRSIKNMQPSSNVNGSTQTNIVVVPVDDTIRHDKKEMQLMGVNENRDLNINNIHTDCKISSLKNNKKCFACFSLDNPIKQ